MFAFTSPNSHLKRQDKLVFLHPDVQHPVFNSFSVGCQRIQNLAYSLINLGLSKYKAT
ncbi:hypothetical protein FB451DRAFT_1229877 [Mycena latifolia]|nr:hypothetical protein FB451DRAFT_1229877 [Mycena latifolia]